MKRLDLTVVISAFNVEKYIEECIKSVLEQTYKDFDIIIVNSGSTDNTKNIIENFIKDHKNIKFISHENKGEGGVRNTGIKNCTSEWISFIDGDDLWEKKKLENQINCLKNNNKAKLVSNIISTIDENGRITGWKLGKLSNGNIYHKVLERNGIANGSTLLIHRSCFEKVGLFNEDILCADWEFCIRAAKEFEITTSPEALVGYRRSKQNISRDYKLIEKNAKKILDNIFEKDKNLTKDFYNLCLSGNAHDIAGLCTVDENYSEAWEYIKKSMTYNKLANFRDLKRFSHIILLFSINFLHLRLLFEKSKSIIFPIVFRTNYGKKFLSSS